MATTLERVEQMEKKLASMAGLIELAAQGNANQPKIVQEIGVVREYAKRIGEQLKSTVDQFNKSIQNTMNFSQLGVNRGLAVEQSLTSLAKTVTALVSELSESKVIDGDNIMTRIRKMDEENEKKRVEAMLKGNTIQAAETVTATSLVVTSEDITEDGKERRLLREYSALELVSKEFPDEVRNALLGKKVGDTADVKDEKEKETLHFKVLEIYELAPRKIEAPAPAPTPAAASGTPTPVPAAPTAPATGASQSAPAQS